MKTFVRSTFLLLLIIFLATVGGTFASAQGTLRVGWPGSPDSLNPGAAVLSEAYVVFELVYDTLFNLELDGSFSPELARDRTVSDDGLVWTFKIVPNVTFHDGEPLTAQDVAFTYTLNSAREDYPYLHAYTTHFESVEAPDDETVVITLDEPIPNIEAQLVFQYILPEHIWGDKMEGSAAVDFENLEMIGSGPFKMEAYQPGEFVRLTANENYFGEVPNVGEVIFQTFNSQDVLVQALRTGQVDMITELPKTAAVALRNDPNIELVTGAPFTPSVTDIIFNQIAPENCPEGSACSGHPALRDITVRKALAHATDKGQIIDVVLLGLGTPGLTLIPDGLGAWYNDTLEDYAYDVERANSLLDEAGYLDTDGNGIREMPGGGQELVFRLNWPSDKLEGPRTAELLSSMWAQVGVGTQLQALDADALTSLCCPAFDFDVMVWGWGSDPDPNLLLGVMTTAAIPTGSSETGYSNPEYDALFAQQSTELDEATRRDLVWQMQQIVFDDVVYVIPFYDQAAQAYRTDRFTGWITDQPKVALEDPTSLTVITPVQ